MISNHWQRIEELFHAASQLSVADRAIFLMRECSDNVALRLEVESLIEASEDNQCFVEETAVSLVMQVISSGIIGELVGKSIGHYKIVALLGSGGMGEVYLADDCTLERQVALKFLAGGFIDNQWAKEQLMKEARAVAKLENPNICGVHGIEEVDEHNFIVMQYVEGETLATLLRDGPLRIEPALEFAEQIASALAAAHQRGIIHRDIKPQNIVVTPDGKIKVLDFGLAKFVRQKVDAELNDDKLDQTSHLGFIVGTVAYMSPEQIDGVELDCRSDIFSFGIVLHEMLCGRNPFLRDTKEGIISAIQTEDPPHLSGELPGELKEISGNCLEKNRGQRFENGEKLLIAIQSLRKKREGRHSFAFYKQALLNLPHVRWYAATTLVIFLLLISAALYAYSKVTRVHTLVVLPIMNQSGDPNLDYLSEGLTRNLFDKFSYLPRLRVRLPTVVASGQNQQIIEVGREFKAEAVLAGEVIKHADSLSLHLTLFNTADGTPRWAQTFSLDSANMFALQDEITRKVTSAIGLWLIGGEQKLLVKRQTDNQEALDAYTRGRYYWGQKRDRKNIKIAIQFFDKAIELDPGFAKAYAGRADCYVLMSNVLYGPLSTKNAMDKARADARQALEIDPSLPEAHTSMGSIRFKYDWQWQSAEQEFKRAIELNPEYAPAHFEYANLLALLKRYDESIRQSEIAQEFDPHSAFANMNYGRALYFARRYETAAKYLTELLEQKPGYPQFLYLKGLVLIQQGKYLDGVAILEALAATDPLFAAAPLGYAYGKLGRITDAERVLQQLDELAKEKPITPQEKALVYIGLGKRDEAFALLEMAYNERFANLVYLTTDPLFDDLRVDPRFGDLARRMNLSL